MKIRLWIALTCALLLTGGCANLLKPAAAVVNDKKIPVDEVEHGLERFKKTSEYQRLSVQGDRQAITRQFEQQFLSQLIRRAVLEPQAEKLGVEVTEQELTDRINEIKDDFQSASAFEEALKEQGLDADQLEQLVRDSLVEEEVRSKVTEGAEPTDSELRDYYELHKGDYEQTRAQHILVDNQNLAGVIATRAADAPKKDADRVFAKLAKQFSTDTSNAKDGGDLGYFSPGDLVAPFEEAADKLRVGEVSSPVKTEFGWHVIRVTDRRLESFEDVKNDIAEQLSVQTEDRVWTDWLMLTYKEADVKVNPRYGEFDLASGQVTDASAEDIPGAEEPSPTPSTSLPG